MRTSVQLTFISILFAFILSACGTPQAALDHANNTAALTVSLSKELSEFREQQAEAAKARIQRIERTTNNILEIQSDTVWRNDIQEAAGNADRLKLYKQLRKLADSRGTNEKALQEKIAEHSTYLNKLVKPLPEQTEALADLQKKLGALGTELTAEERGKIVMNFAKQVHKAARENKEKIEAAKADAEASGN